MESATTLAYKAHLSDSDGAYWYGVTELLYDMCGRPNVMKITIIFAKDNKSS